jgi:hypothetical protein
MPDELLGWPIRTPGGLAPVPGASTLILCTATPYGPMLVAVGMIVGVLERRRPAAAVDADTFEVRQAFGLELGDGTPEGAARAARKLGRVDNVG